MAVVLGRNKVSVKMSNGKSVEVDEAMLLVIEDAHNRALDEVLEMLTHDYDRYKECGDTTTAEVFDLVRAKVRSKKDPK